MTTGKDIDRAVQALRRLPAESRQLVVSLIEQLAEAKGVSVAAEYKAPIENIGEWVTKLRSERMSERTVKLYEYLARQVLERMPKPTKAEVRGYLAKRLKEAKPSTVENERKAFGSLFSFLYKEGLWPENPMEGVAHVGERWGEGERKCPSPEDVERVLEVGFARARMPTHAAYGTLFSPGEPRSVTWGVVEDAQKRIAVPDIDNQAGNY